MTPYRELSKEQLQAMKGDLEKQFEEVKAKGLNLDMSRGKPCKEQLNLSMGMLEELKSTDKLKCETGIDCRNYGMSENRNSLFYYFAVKGWSEIITSPPTGVSKCR